MTTLLLSGWAQPADALSHLAENAVLFDYSDYPSPDAAIDALSTLKPKHIIGWSLGGNLALRAIGAGALKPEHLTLIGAPMRFVGEHGMGPETFHLFRESYASDPTRTKGRFHALIAKGDLAARQVMELLGHHPKVEEISRWLPWLDDLGNHAISAEMLASVPPTLIIQGMNDAIVPYAQSELLARALPNAQLNRWEGVGHAPHLHDAARLRQEIAQHREAA